MHLPLGQGGPSTKMWLKPVCASGLGNKTRHPTPGEAEEPRAPPPSSTD